MVGSDVLRRLSADHLTASSIVLHSFKTSSEALLRPLLFCNNKNKKCTFKVLNCKVYEQLPKLAEKKQKVHL